MAFYLFHKQSKYYFFEIKQILSLKPISMPMKPFITHNVFLIACFIFLSSFSQAQEIVWQKTIGGSGDDALSNMIQTADGGFIIGGSSKSNISGDKTENNRDTTLATRDYWIIKLDSAGNIQWQNTIGGAGDDFVAEIKATNDGGYIIGGSSKSEMGGDKTENGCNPYANYGDYWIVKLDSLGNIQWQNTIGGGLEDYIFSISQTIDGGYICGGESHSTAICDKTQGNNGGGTSTSDFWIIKLDTIGNIQWQSTIGGGSWSDDVAFQRVKQQMEVICLVVFLSVILVTLIIS